MDSNEPRARGRVGFGGRASAKLVGAVAAASLAIPAAASADNSTPPVLHRDGSKAVRFVADVSTPPVLHRDGSKAVPFVADVSTPTVAAAPGDGFDWGDALIGAGAALGIVAVGGAGLALQRRRAVGAALSGS